MADKRKTISSYYPLDRSAYKILHEIGSGVSGVVYKAICLPLEATIVAIKAIDLERTRANLDDVRREAKIMTLLSHPNVLTAHCSFTVDHHLWVVMPFMAAGSLHSIISSSFPDGLSEPSIAIVLKETLLALRYLHSQGHLHRDIKAGNILVDSDGSVKLADFGVSASLYEPSSSSSSHSLSSLSLSFFNELAGTPYWMAPEVIHSHVGYGFKADIWSFGITAMELAHGRPPLSHLPPSKSLVMRITNRLGLNYEDDNKSKNNNKKPKNKKKFSKAFKDMVASCLSQDPSKRPSAEKLLKHPFFKNCKHPDYLVRHVLKGLPTVEERFKEFIKGDDDDDDDGDDDGKSPPTKNRRISGWNFNEDVLQFDPVFPTDNQSGNILRQVQFTDEDEKGSSLGSGSNQDGFPSPSFSSSSSGNSRGKGCCDGEKDDIKKSKNNDNDDGNGNDNQQHPKKEEAEKVEGEARLVSNGRTAWPEAMVPSLLSLLSSLSLEQQMVMNVLESCAGGGVDGWRRRLMNGGEEEEREEKALMELVTRLQQSVDSLNLQLQNERRKNSALEQELKALKLKV